MDTLEKQPESFEDALKELEQIVRKLESGQVSLEESINFYTRGSELKKFCEEKLSKARMKVEMVMRGNSGEAELKEFNPST